MKKHYYVLEVVSVEVEVGEEGQFGEVLGQVGEFIVAEVQF